MSDTSRRTIITAGLAVAAGAGVATAHGLYQVAVAARVTTPIAWLYPLITDGLALVAYAATARLTDGGRRYAASIVALAAGLSALAQAVYLVGALDHATAPVGLRFGVGAWPAIAAALTAHLLHLITDAGCSTSTVDAYSRSTSGLDVYSEPSNPAVQARTTPERSAKPMNTLSAGQTARDRARAVAQHHHATHGDLPSVTKLARLADVSRGTASNALKDLRAERPTLHIVNAEHENRNDS
jgi:hypothetical protein